MKLTPLTLGLSGMLRSSGRLISDQLTNRIGHTIGVIVNELNGRTLSFPEKSAPAAGVSVTR